MDAGPGAFVIGWIVLHVAALVTAYGTRVAAETRLECPVQFCFFAAMTAIGVAAWICQQHEMGSWGLSAVTLVGMVVTAVVDFRRFSEPAQSRHWPLSASEQR